MMSEALVKILPAAEDEAQELLAMYEADGEQGIGEGDWASMDSDAVSALVQSQRWALKWVGEERRLFRVR